eukprot:3399338-Prymnesium_polylepis.1
MTKQRCRLVVRPVVLIQSMLVEASVRPFQAGDSPAAWPLRRVSRTLDRSLRRTTAPKGNTAQTKQLPYMAVRPANAC